MQLFFYKLDTSKKEAGTEVKNSKNGGSSYIKKLIGVEVRV